MTSINGEAPFLDMSAETGQANNNGQGSMEYRGLYDPVDAAQDSRAVNRFSKFMLAKMAQAGACGRSGWYDKKRCTREYLSDLLRRAVAKGDPVDIANYAMMLHDRGETVAPVGGEFDPGFLDPIDQIEIIYTNYKGETAKRTITPLNLWRGATEWHPEPQWLVTAYDHDKKALRDFALKDFGYSLPSAARVLPLEEAFKAGAEWADECGSGDSPYLEGEAREYATRALSSPDHADANTLETYYARQIEWSKNTFGPALRTKGIIDHIKKELKEIEADPRDLSEWIDVVILAMDGFWRHGGFVADLLPRLLAKQKKNMARTWADWRTMSEDQAIEHDRSQDADRADTVKVVYSGPESALVSKPTTFPNGLEVITYPVASFLHEPGKLDAPVAALSGRLHRSHAKAIAAAITGTAPKITIEGE